MHIAPSIGENSNGVPSNQTMASSSSYGSELLKRQFMELTRNPPEGVSVGLGDDDNIFCWELMIVGPPDTLYEGGFFAAKLEFPKDFPNAPPVMTFKTPIWHPNGEHWQSWLHRGAGVSRSHCQNDSRFTFSPPPLPPPSLPFFRDSVRGWQGVHLHPPRPWRRQDEPIRKCRTS